MGDAAPEGGVFREFIAPVINEVGQVALRATLADGREGVFLWKPPGPRVRFSRIDGDDVILTIPSSTGSTFQLQWRDSLIQGSWINEGSAIPGDGSEIELRHVGGALLGGQFYRVEIR